MKKALNIAWKDLLVMFRDPSALILLLVTPFALTLAIAFAFGGLTGGGGGGTGLGNIPVVIVNHDTGELGAYLVQTFESEDLADLLAPVVAEDEAAARAAVDADQTAAVVVIPAGFSERVLSAAAAPASAPEQSVIEIYTNPTRPISAGIIRSIVDNFVGAVAAGSTAGQVTVGQLVTNGLISPQQAAQLGQEIGQRAGEAAAESHPIALDSETVEGEQGFDWLTYMSPSMAVLFLMFTVTAGGRTILAERDEGTLPRMLTTPTSAVQVIGGKALGIYAKGLVQLAVLMAAGGLLFGVSWGAPSAIAPLALALVAAATGWGMLLAAYARSPGQANSVGTAITLTFAAVAGNFMPRQVLPDWLKTVSYVSPNAWGMEAFIDLTAGGTLTDVVTPIAALVVMAAVLLGVSVLAFRRQYR